MTIDYLFIYHILDHFCDVFCVDENVIEKLVYRSARIHKQSCHRQQNKHRLLRSSGLDGAYHPCLFCTECMSKMKDSCCVSTGCIFSHQVQQEDSARFPEGLCFWSQFGSEGGTQCSEELHPGSSLPVQPLEGPPFLPNTSAQKSPEIPARLQGPRPPLQPPEATAQCKAHHCWPLGLPGQAPSWYPW